MSLLNPPESRPTVILLIARRLAGRPDVSEGKDSLIRALAAHGTDTRNPAHDVQVNLSQSTMLEVVEESDDVVHLSSDSRDALQTDSFAKFLRKQVMEKRLNQEPWGSQEGARDLTNGLAWFLSLPATELPEDFADGGVNVQTIQAQHFGERREGEENNWPIVNRERWVNFQRWACGLGFAWKTPTGLTVPDPTATLRDVIPEVFADESRLSAVDFLKAIAKAVPVLDGGAYRKFVQDNLAQNQRLGPPKRLSQALTDALRRLERSSEIKLEERDDAQARHDATGRPFTHVAVGS
jgi:hypothetical protein